MLPPPPSRHRFVYQRVSAVSESYRLLCQGRILTFCSEQGLLCTSKRPYTCALCHSCSAESLSLTCKIGSTIHYLCIEEKALQDTILLLWGREVFVILTIPVCLSETDLKIIVLGEKFNTQFERFFLVPHQRF